MSFSMSTRSATRSRCWRRFRRLEYRCAPVLPAPSSSTAYDSPRPMLFCRNKERTEMAENKELSLRHTLATLAYRGARAVRNAPPEFGDFRAGEKTRTPLTLLAHI